MRCSHFSTVSSGNGAAPEMELVMPFRSMSCFSAASMTLEYSVGTPGIQEGLRFLITSISSGISGFGTSTISPPSDTASPAISVRPYTWNIGSAPSTRSSGLRPRVGKKVRIWAIFAEILPWVSSAPFGVPVVPEVYRINAVESLVTQSGVRISRPSPPKASLAKDSNEMVFGANWESCLRFSRIDGKGR